jgi:hypothetical protein
VLQRLTGDIFEIDWIELQLVRPARFYIRRGKSLPMHRMKISVTLMGLDTRCAITVT